MMGAPTRHRGRSRYPTRSRNAGASGAAPATFNPLTDWTTDPVHGVWASDPLWSAPADGGAVASWRNGGTVGGDPAQGTGSMQPTYRASTAAFGNRPTVQFDGGDVLAVDVADVAQPFYIVAVAASSAGILVGNGTDTTQGLRPNNVSTVLLRFGTTLSGSTANTDPHLLVATANGGSSAVTVDLAAAISGAAGAAALTVLSLGAGNGGIGTYGNYLTGSIAYMAIFNTNPTALPEWATFTAWVESTYNIPLP